MNTYRTAGFEILNNFYSEEIIDTLTRELQRKNVFDYTEHQNHDLIHSVDMVHALFHSAKMRICLDGILKSARVISRAIVLDKTRKDNWGLDWHQDLKIAVQTKIETPGYYSWSEEAGVSHVIPPEDVLQKMITVRIHLDDTDSENGAMVVIPGSHQAGIIEENKIQEYIIPDKIHTCAVQKGGVMIMSPLLLHKSPYSQSNRSRRILQVQYAATDLENGLAWLQ